jgi:CBS domain-containing protein
MKVADVMTRDVVAVDPTSSLLEALKKLKKSRVNGLVVLEGRRIVGVITKADIFRAILPSYLDLVEDERYLTDPEFAEERVGRLLSVRVEEIMTPSPLTIGSEAPIVKAGAIMVARKIKQMPVVEGGELVGIVTLTDILDRLAGKYL